MSSYFPYIELNGTIDTSNTVFDNLQLIANNSGSFLTWDPELGQWRLIINRAESAPYDAAFDDDNIVGAINITGTGISDLYNGVKVSFRNDDLEGDKEEEYYEILASERFAEEVDNVLTINYTLITQSVQAQRLAQIELKQTRMDKVIQFATDYRAIGLKPGDIIQISNDIYGYTNKLFRVIQVLEEDLEDGGLLLGVTAHEFDNSIYSTDGLTARQRNKNVGIIPSTSNECVVESDAELIAEQVGQSLATPNGLNNITQEQTYGSTSISVPLFQTESVGWSSSAVNTVYGTGTSSAAYLQATFETYRPIKNCIIFFEAPQGDINITVDGSTKTLAALGLPSTVTVYSRPFDVNTGTGSGSYAFETVRYMEWSSYFTAISLATASPRQFLIQVSPLNTYDLSANNSLVTFNSSSNYIANANGDYATLNVLAFLN